jgi:hypothetical protein
MDFAFSNTRSIYANGEVNRMTNTPSIPGNEGRRRIYLGHLHDIIHTTWNADYMGGWQDHLRGLSPAQNWDRPNSGSYSIAGRAANVLSQIGGAIPETEFAITTPSPLVVDASTATVTGAGWINVREIRLAGAREPLAVRWIDEDVWEVTFPVGPGVRSYQLQAFDFSGELLDSQSITIENTSVVEPASAANLVISELMYHPADPDAVEFAAGFEDEDRFEFVELMNIGAEAVDLTGVSFTEGIVHDLPAFILAPGERRVLARDQQAFLFRYPGREAVLLPGEYQGPEDSNQFANGGERVVLSDAFGFEIRSFVYGDQFPWPSESDGVGPSLTLMAPLDNPDHAVPANWRRSLEDGGSPGESDALVFDGEALADEDGDGLPALLEFATGSSDLVFNSGPQLGRDDFGHLVFSYPRRLGTDGVILEAEVSGDLSQWDSITGSFALIGQSGEGDNLRTLVWRSLLPAEDKGRQFFRLRARAR